MRPTIRIFALVALAVTVALPSACKPGAHERRLPETGAKLEGTVTYNGQKLEFALIQVLSETGSATGMIGDDGKYVVENAPLGEVKIGVNTSAARGQFQSKIMSQNASAADPNKSNRIAQPKFMDVPEKYFNPETSGITTTIERGANGYEIVIR